MTGIIWSCLHHMVIPSPPPAWPSCFQLCFETEKYLSHLQKSITVLHIHSHTNYKVQKIFLVIEKGAAGIHAGSTEQGHSEMQRRDCRDSSLRWHWPKWCVPLLPSLFTGRQHCKEWNASYGWSYERLLKKNPFINTLLSPQSVNTLSFQMLEFQQPETQ